MFRRIENLQGGTSSDSFQFTPTGRLAGSINGQAGIDTLDYSQFGDMAVRVNLSQNKATLVDGGVSGIENVNGGAGDDVLSAIRRRINSSVTAAVTSSSAVSEPIF